MEAFIYAATFLLIRRLQNSLKFSPLQLKWKSVLNVALAVSILLFIAAMIFFEGPVISFAGCAMLSALLIYIDKEPDFVSMKSYTRAHYPLVAAVLLSSLVELIAPAFYEKWDNFFKFAIIAAFVWIFARWASTKKQREELNIISLQNQQLDKLVAERTSELTRQKNELQETILLLQTTQQQLIQSEKLASLGELTAGIAHEIQNPLNFVSNFSEVSIELSAEMKEELKNGNTSDAIAIAEDIEQNLQKIIHHGKRADAIVKGMLQHSRASNGQMEPTDINVLADEYLRLAYHGLRAKDKTFNVDMVTDFSKELPLINVIPQDVGRVMLNLFTNSFYAVQHKQKTAGDGYKPTLELSTRAISFNTGSKNSIAGRGIEISVKDNGIGIPDDIKDKIMQPFFTTKPTGQGTGLGLSMSYDIIVKGHSGKIDINTKEGEFTEFIVSLPS